MNYEDKLIEMKCEYEWNEMKSKYEWDEMKCG